MSANPQQPETAAVDLTNCDREPIHRLGLVQPFGFLLATTPDEVVERVSANVGAYLSRAPEDLLGRRLDRVLSPACLDWVRSCVDRLDHADAVQRMFGVEISKDTERRFDIAIHRSDEATVLEFEPSVEDEWGLDAEIRSMMDRVSHCPSIDELLAAGARLVKGLTGFDRVMVYRFDEDGSGEVVAEAKEPALGPYLGLRYPAEDIPRQARILYKRNILRIIADVRGPVSPILSQSDSEAAALDLSLSGLRAVSPIHLEYLRNMGVDASMSISILVRGELWGLFACHHMQPRVLSFHRRSTAELFGKLFALVLEQKLNEAEQAEHRRAKRIHDDLMARFATEPSVTSHLETIMEAIPSVIATDGVVSWIDGEFRSTGSTPDREAFEQIVPFLNDVTVSGVYATHQLGQEFPPARAYADQAAGLLAIPMSRTPKDYVVLFRREIAQSVRWGGNPEKITEVGPNGDRLTPRKSFETWLEVVRGQSSNWSSSEIQAAEAIRMTLLEVVLQLTETANRERARAQERQEILIAELNHRVRNTLNLIQGLLQKSAETTDTVAELTGIVGNRIQALARAHDQISTADSGPAPLRGLLEAEMEAYLGDRSAAVTIDSPNVALEPSALRTMSLVIHEMMTNSAKHGALSLPQGRVEIAVTHDAEGLAISWRERDGPTVRPPTRRGFGSTIIERSIPFELQGKADVRFDPDGLKADFRIPARHVADRPTTAERAAPAAERAAAVPDGGPALSGEVLIVEDNMIIALEAEMILTELGADQVRLASNAAEGLRILDRHDIRFALLDVNLGHETSESVARRLAEAGIAFAFATGYGEEHNLIDEFPDVTVLQKPFDRSAIARAAAGAVGD